MRRFPLARHYTADGYAYALREVVRQQKPRFVVFSHTYMVRDFAPKAGRVAASGAGE